MKKTIKKIFLSIKEDPSWLSFIVSIIALANALIALAIKVFNGV